MGWGMLLKDALVPTSLAAHGGCSVPLPGERQHKKIWWGFLLSAPEGSLLEAGRSLALTGMKNMSGELKWEGDRPLYPKDARTSTKLGAQWGGCCPPSGPAGFSAESWHGGRAQCHLILRGEGFGDWHEPQCFWLGILVA